MKLLASLREPDQPLTDTLEIVDGREVWHFNKPYPPVIRISTRYLALRRKDAPRFEQLGYRPVERGPWDRTTKYVRPLPLWLCHWVIIAAHRALWDSLKWLYRLGIIRLACDEAVVPRLRDIRPWPMRGRSWTRRS